MAMSLSNFVAPIFLLLCFSLLSRAATVTYDFNVEWVTSNPDGQFERRTIGINGQWPIPAMVANVGDRVIVNVHNGLGDWTTGLHFHGLFQNGTNQMDGAMGVTQCAIPPGGDFTYNFTIQQPGTYWYHSHVKGQYPDGLRGPLIIHDPDSPIANMYDEEVVMTLSDWYHDEMRPLMADFMSVTNPTGAEPVPQAALMNETQNATFAVQPGRTYMFRIINMGAFAAQYVWFVGHTMRIVEVDGVYTEPAEANMIYLTAAQRYSVLVTMKNDTSANFPIVGSMDEDLFDAIPDGLNSNVTSWLVYDDSKPLPAAEFVDEFDPYDDYELVPIDAMPLLDQVDYSFNLDVKMDNLGDGANYAFFNEHTYVHPKVPSLYTALSTGSEANNPAIYGANSNAFVLQKGEVIEIVMNNEDPGKHPFHIHGHHMQLVHRSEDEAGLYEDMNVTQADFPATPMRRDTVLVRPNGNIVLRFRADNPGVWFFHCHIEWHVVSGLVATMVEAPTELQSTLDIPEDHWAACRAQGIPTAGNAAGNTEDLLDLSGAETSPDPLPAGFTARGIVALVFSIVAAFLGMAAISWYGAAPLGEVAMQQVQKRVAESGVET
ncbi:Cupredoxin [Lineolata rhizophorae]|uniref:Cupredoxin n=1 Tax=Lineolata rhizophorae TaxID=578093 RepID=A0A6A6PCX7_9PEZI|nr:Cupredoxin [Lineolata rhizophorae]